MPFGFLNPSLLLGLLGVGVPVLVHLLGRRRARPRRFAAIEFLLASQKRLAARRRLRHLLLLLARALLIAAVVLAIARPLLEGASVAGAGQPVSAVVVLDRTASMAVDIDGESAFERARSGLIQSLERLPSGSEVAVVAIDRRAQRLTEGWVPIERGVRALQDARIGWAAGEARAALIEASSLLGGARRTARIVYVASDLQASTWGSQATDIPALEAEIVVLDPTAGRRFRDVGLIAVVRGGLDGLELEVEAVATAGDGSDTPVQSVVQLEIDGELAARGVVKFGPDGIGSTLLTLPDDLARGAAVVLALAEPDALHVNDRYHVRVDRPSRRRVLIGDGAPHADLYRDEIFYLQAALLTEAERLRTRIVDVTLGELSPLDDVDVVVLANAERLFVSEVARLTAWVEAGGGLLIAVGDRVDPDRLGDWLGPLLPARVIGHATQRPGEPPLNLAPPRLARHAVLLPFDSSRSARFTRTLSVEPLEGAQVLLAYDDGRPALVERSHGRGRVLLFTSSLDRGWNDLPVKPGYVPLTTRSVLYLAGALQRPRRDAYLVGEVAAIELDAEEATPRVAGPDGAWLSVEPVEDAAFAVADTHRPGLYRAHVGDERRVDLDVVVNVDGAESDATRLEAPDLRVLLGERVEVGDSAGVRVRREDQAALPILILVSLAFLVEAVLGRRRSEPEREAA